MRAKITESEKLVKCKIAIIAFGILNRSGSGGGFIAWHIANKLYTFGCLEKVVIFNKGNREPDFNCAEPIPFTKYYLLFRKIVGRGMNLPYHILRGIDERLCDIFCRRTVDIHSDICLMTHPVFPRTLKMLKSKGAITILLAPNPFDMFIENLVIEEKRRYSIAGIDAYTSKFRLKEMERCFKLFDYVISLSSVVTSTYTEYGYGEKIINLESPLGLNIDELHVKEERRDKVFRVCYMAHTVLLKGLHYLLEAWKQININDAKLIIGGNIDKNVRKIIDQYYANLNNVEYVGTVEDINGFYGSNSLFVCPSIIDAYPRTVFEAMACGLPVIVTEGCGASDIVADGMEGFIVPIRDARALGEKILWFKKHPEEIHRMGYNAREKIKKYSVERFSEEIVKVLMTIKL